MDNLTLALDWTPNINHIGFFVAQEMGFYLIEGVNLKILSPSMDGYATTPAKKVELGEADFALCPTESVISYQTKNNPFKLIGVATIFQSDVSAIAVRPDQGISSPKDLDGKTYASYNARYEDAIVREMIKNDGGKGNIISKHAEKLGLWDTLLMGAYDSTWVFLNWEGVEAEGNGEVLSYFKLSDYDIPYSYSPLIAVSQEKLEEKKELYQKFIKATRKGFLTCLEEPKECLEILKPYVPFYDSKIDLRKTLEISIEHFGNESNWGTFDEESVEIFLNWLEEHNLEPTRLKVSEVITNKLLLD